MGRQTRQSRRTGKAISVVALVCWLLLLPAFATLPALADEELDRRTTIGIKLFRTTLGADTSIEEKRGPDGRLTLILYYTHDRDRAEELAGRLTGAGEIRGLPIEAVLSDDPSLAAFEEKRPAAVFITEEPVGGGLGRLIDFARRHRILLFSPIRGHVEEGVAAGLFIAAKVRPYVNPHSLEASGINLRSFFIRIAKRVGEGS
ncbi:hypothetical protein [Endothiovibrio diazotrophicus]